MTDPVRASAKPAAGAAAGAARAADDAKLRNAARQLEGVFTQQLFKAMRATVPEDQGALGGGSAQEMFTGLLDEHLATDPRAASTHGIGEAIYHHLLRTRGAQTSPQPAPQAAPRPTSAPPGVTAPQPGASLRKSP